MTGSKQVGRLLICLWWEAITGKRTIKIRDFDLPGKSLGACESRKRQPLHSTVVKWEKSYLAKGENARPLRGAYPGSWLNLPGLMKWQVTYLISWAPISPCTHRQTPGFPRDKSASHQPWNSPNRIPEEGLDLGSHPPSKVKLQWQCFVFCSSSVILQLLLCFS